MVITEIGKIKKPPGPDAKSGSGLYLDGRTRRFVRV